MTDTAVATILARLDKFEADVNGRLAKIEAKLDEKPGTATIYQVTFGTVLGLIAFAGALTGLFKATGIIP